MEKRKDKEKLIKYLKSVYSDLDNLCKRLQDSYNNQKEFCQCEEDRLILYNILEFIDNIK